MHGESNVRTTTTEYTCDICGKLWTKTEEMAHKLPNLSTLSSSDTGALSFADIPGDYCDECVEAVRVARDRVIKERKALADVH